MPDLSPKTWLDFLDGVSQLLGNRFQAHRLSLCNCQLNKAVHLKILCPLLLPNAGMERIWEYLNLLAMKKSLGSSGAVRIGRVRHQGVNQGSLNIEDDVSLPPQSTGH
jgi:hypothetical protein